MSFSELRRLLGNSEYVLVVIAIARLVAAAVGGTLILRSEQESLQLEVTRARMAVTTVNQVWSLYTDKVATRIHPGSATSNSSDYGNQRDSIPVPATFIIELAKQLTEELPGQSFRLYSDFPFFSRASGYPPIDGFSRSALDSLIENPSEPFYRFETVDGVSVLRYAEALVMAPLCVTCHNSHADSPRTDWKVGDVRGVVEISQVANLIVAPTWTDKIARRLFVVGGLIFAMAGIGFWYLRSRRASRDVEQQVKLRTEEFRHQARIDGLTEIANRRAFDERLAQAWSSMNRSGSCLSLILGDIDFFKRYNDCYGHPAGDECLRVIARVMSDGVRRPDDLVARYGGEEFGVILPGTNAQGAWQIAQQVRKAVRDQGIPHRDSDVADCVTLSLGVATCNDSADFSASDLLQLADDALYEAKTLGRDQCVARCYPESPLQSPTLEPAS